MIKRGQKKRKLLYSSLWWAVIRVKSHEHHGISNHWQLFVQQLFHGKIRINTLPVLCEGKYLPTGGFPSQRATRATKFPAPHWHHAWVSMTTLNKIKMPLCGHVKLSRNNAKRECHLIKNFKKKHATHSTYFREMKSLAASGVNVVKWPSNCSDLTVKFSK